MLLSYRWYNFWIDRHFDTFSSSHKQFFYLSWRRVNRFGCLFDLSKKETMKKIKTHSTITCPNCGFKKEELMPTDACLFFYECTSCRTRLKSNKGDCCVFCSFGTVPCPPIQEGECCYTKICETNYKIKLTTIA